MREIGEKKSSMKVVDPASRVMSVRVEVKEISVCFAEVNPESGQPKRQYASLSMRAKTCQVSNWPCQKNGCADGTFVDSLYPNQALRILSVGAISLWSFL